MWLVYAVAFLLGAGILLIQLISGDDGHSDAAGLDHDLLPGHHPSEGPGLLSMRSSSYGLFTFGFVGGIVHVLGLARPGAALALAVACGLGTMLFVGLTFRNLGDPAVSGEAGVHEAEGARARVLVPCSRGGHGKVRLTLKGQTVDLLATTDEEVIAAGEDVLIAEVRDAVAHVRRLQRGEESS